MDRSGGINGVRSSIKRDNTGSVISPNAGLYPPKMSPCSEGGHDSDKLSEGGIISEIKISLNI